MEENKLRSHVKSNEWLHEETRSHGGPPLTVGWGNGYVRIPPDSPLFGMSTNELDSRINVHGGLTYGKVLDLDTINFWEELDARDHGWYMVGFDTHHRRDNPTDQNQEFVEKETARLLEQLQALHDRLKIGLAIINTALT